MFCALRVFQPESLAESNRPTTQSFPRPRETAKLNIAIGLQSNAPYISARKSAVLGRDGGFSFADLQHPPRVIHYLSRGSDRGSLHHSAMQKGSARASELSAHRRSRPLPVSVCRVVRFRFAHSAVGGLAPSHCLTHSSGRAAGTKVCSDCVGRTVLPRSRAGLLKTIPP